MKKLLSLMVFIIINTIAQGQCTSLFSFAAYFNTVNFLNQSTVSNAHYFWDFGDGTGSNLAAPIHIYPDNGNYLVTLFAEDTVSKCSSYYEYWTNVTKYSIDTCQPSISDSISNGYGAPELTVYNTSINCNNYNIDVSGGNSWNFASGSQMYLWTSPFYIVCVGQYYDNYGHLKREAYKTAYHNCSNSHNYGNCSANFEFVPVSKDGSGERILFTAMNKFALHYSWFISGFGNPITSSYDSISQFYPYSSPGTWIVVLATQDSDGCIDTVCRNIAVSDSIKTTLSVDNVKYNSGEINVYPNPNNGKFAIVIASETKQSLAIMEVYNVLGEKVYSQIVHSSPFIVDLGTQPNGVYLYRALSENGSLIGEGKLVIQK